MQKLGNWGFNYVAVQDRALKLYPGRNIGYHSVLFAAAILDSLQTGLMRAISTCLRWFLKTLYPYLSPCKISRTGHKVHDSLKLPPRYLASSRNALNYHYTYLSRYTLQLSSANSRLPAVFYTLLPSFYNTKSLACYYSSLINLHTPSP